MCVCVHAHFFHVAVYNFAFAFSTMEIAAGHLMKYLWMCVCVCMCMPGTKALIPIMHQALQGLQHCTLHHHGNKLWLQGGTDVVLNKGQMSQGVISQTMSPILKHRVLVSEYQVWALNYFPQREALQRYNTQGNKANFISMWVSWIIHLRWFIMLSEPISNVYDVVQLKTGKTIPFTYSDTSLHWTTCWWY